MGALPAEKVVPLARRGRTHHPRHAPWRVAVDQLDLRVAGLERRIVDFDRRIAMLTERTRMRVALLLSLALHATVIAGVAFTLPKMSPPSDLNQPLEVVLVNAKSIAKPPQPDALAQASLDGGGNTDAARRAKSPFPVKPQEEPRQAAPAPAPRPVEQPRREAREVVAKPQPQVRPEIAVAQPEPSQPEPAPPTQLPQVQSEAPAPPSAAQLMQRSLEIARLEAQISRELDNYQKRPRRRFIGARTQEFRFARYIEDWRHKIERIGELNYPQAARDQRIYGSLVVTVSIKASGVLEKVEINRPSGWRILDEAALHIVKLAAPFAPFPPDIARDTDILSITRTWTFTRSDQLVAD
jgi:periplasmic protein TonB